MPAVYRIGFWYLRKNPKAPVNSSCSTGFVASAAEGFSVG